jgi:hypothetical protein
VDHLSWPSGPFKLAIWPIFTDQADYLRLAKRPIFVDFQNAPIFLKAKEGRLTNFF